MQPFLTIRSNDPELVLRGRLLKGAALVIIVSLLCIIPIILWLAPSETPTVVGRLIFVMICSGIVWALAHAGIVNAGGFLLCFALLASNIVGAMTFPDNLLLLAVLRSNYIAVILTAGMVIGAWATLLFGSISLAAILLVLIVPSWGTSAAIGDGFLCVICAGLLWLTIRTLEQAVANARQHTAAAQQAEQHLALQQSALLASNAELTEVNQRTAKLLDVIHDLETPLIPLFRGVLILPLVGYLDDQRTRQITETTLAAVYQQRANTVIIDITGTAAVDTAALRWLNDLSEAIRLLGARSLLTGISADVAMAMVLQGVEMAGIQTFGQLQDGIAAVFDALHNAHERGN